MCPFCGCSKDAVLSCLSSSCCMWHSIAWKAPSQHPILTLKKGHLRDGLEIVDLWIFEVNEKGYTRKHWHKEFKFKTDERAGTFQPKSRSALSFFFPIFILHSREEWKTVTEFLVILILEGETQNIHHMQLSGVKIYQTYKAIIL